MTITEKDIQKVKKILSKTTAAGCSASEAASARKVAENILSKYGITLDDWYKVSSKAKTENTHAYAYSRPKTKPRPKQRTTGYTEAQLLAVIQSLMADSVEMSLNLKSAESSANFWKKLFFGFVIVDAIISIFF